jgi:Domain of unknown function (DUF4331)/Secretion system C-terminal sorting domain
LCLCGKTRQKQSSKPIQIFGKQSIISENILNMKQKIIAAFLLLVMLVNTTYPVFASSHREAPLIADDPLADNIDLYAFRDPNDPTKINIIANYIPFQLPQGGPNFYSFGDDVRYEIHIDNNVANNSIYNGDDIVYRFTFKKQSEDTSTFFNIRLGKQNLKTTYNCERSIDGGVTFTPIVTNGVVPPPNIGPRSITSPVGLNAPDYNSLITSSIATASTGEKVFAGTADDPFFVDLGGIFDLGDVPRTDATKPFDGLKCKNVSTIALQVDIATLQKDKKPAAQAANILDGDYIIGVWASASRRKITTINTDGTRSSTGAWVQVSRLGMPLTNEAVIPVGNKDLWNSLTPYQEAILFNFDVFKESFYNPELALYMDDSQFGGAVPALKPLRVQSKSLGQYDFRNGKNGLQGLKGSSTVSGTALDDAIAGNLLLPGNGKPRSVDLWPIFHTGVPNLRPYQLATGKNGNPLATGKPFINNFLPNGGDMLRLNMAVPPTPRNDPKFSSLGLVNAAVLGLTDAAYNTNSNLQFIPNMDGFPNGRRLEDDVTRIELQAVSGVVLAAIGLWYDDYTPGGANPVTPQLVNVLSYTTGIEKNDTAFKTAFPYQQTPWPGTCDCAGLAVNYTQPAVLAPSSSIMGVAAPEVFVTSTPNPFAGTTTIRYRVDAASQITVGVHDVNGNQVNVLVNANQAAGTYSVLWNSANVTKGVYFVKVMKNGSVIQTIRVVKQ